MTSSGACAASEPFPFRSPVSESAISVPPNPLPRLLVSVRDAAEAEAAICAGADLIDAKDPENGALGALSPEIVRAIVARTAGRAATSAVAGEPAAAARQAAIRAMAETGVAWVKVAVRPDWLADAASLRAAGAAAPGRLVAVLFAEDHPEPDCAPRLAAAGFIGAMIDTALKDGRRLPDLVGWVAPFRLHRRGSGRGAGVGARRVVARRRHPRSRRPPAGLSRVPRRPLPRRRPPQRPRRPAALASRAGASPAGRARRGVSVRTVVKVGGSLCADPARLRALLASLAEGAFGACLVVPGGGEYADAVRAAQRRDGFDDCRGASPRARRDEPHGRVFSRDRAAPLPLPPLRGRVGVA